MSDGLGWACHGGIDWMLMQAFYDKAHTRMPPLFQNKPLLLAWSMASSVEMWEGGVLFLLIALGRVSVWRHSGFLDVSDKVALLETCEDLAVGA